jgi:hypothetical protein
MFCRTSGLDLSKTVMDRWAIVHICVNEDPKVGLNAVGTGKLSFVIGRIHSFVK